MIKSASDQLNAVELGIVESSLSVFYRKGLAGLMNHIITLQLRDRVFRMDDVRPELVTVAIQDGILEMCDTFTLDAAEKRLISAFISGWY